MNNSSLKAKMNYSIQNPARLFQVHMQSMQRPYTQLLPECMNRQICPGCICISNQSEPGADQEPMWYGLAAHSRGTTSSQRFEMQCMKALAVKGACTVTFSGETRMHYVKTDENRNVGIFCVLFLLQCNFKEADSA